MFVRHRLISISTFLLAAILLSAGSARGQQRPGPGQHESLPGTITPDQIKRALEGRGGGLPDLPPELLEMFKDQIQKQGKQPVDDRDLKQAVDRLRSDPNLRKQMEEMGD